MEKIIVITGGTDGLGKEIAKIYSTIKDNIVVVISNDEMALSETMKELNCKGLLCDVSDYRQVKLTIETITKKYEKIDILVNSAGIYINGELESNSYDNIKKVIETNTTGTIFFCRAVLPFMKSAGGGKILNIVCKDGLVPKAMSTVYQASKWAITGFTDSLWEEVAKKNIQVMGLYPSLIGTKFRVKAGGSPEVADGLNPGDVAKVAEFMLSFGDIVFQKVAVTSRNSL